MGLWVALLLADAAWLTDSDAAIRGVPAMSCSAWPLVSVVLYSAGNLDHGSAVQNGWLVKLQHAPSSLRQASRNVIIRDR